MKICYLGNPNSIKIRNWVNFFVDKGHDLSIITREFSEYENARVYPISKYYKEAPNIRIIGFALYNLNRFKRYLLLKNLIRKINPEIYHAHYLTDYGILSAKLNLHPLIITCMGDDVLIAPDKFGKKHVKEMKKVLNKADVIHSVSEQITNEIKKLGIDENKIKTISRGTNLNLFNNKSNRQIPKEINDWSDKKIIISTRQFLPVYNQETIIKAIPKVAKEEPGVRFLFLGDGTDFNKTKMLAKRLKIEKYVKFIGKVQYDHVSEFLKESKIYVSSSISDGTSSALLEAMACGVFPIVTDIPGNRPWVTHGENGFLFEKGDYNKLSKLILKIINDEEVIKDVVKINREIVKEKGDWEKNTRKLEKMYANLVRR